MSQGIQWVLMRGLGLFVGADSKLSQKSGSVFGRRQHPLPIQRYKPAMTALSDPIVIGLMIFNIVMLLGYFSSKWLKACEPGAKKEHS